MKVEVSTKMVGIIRVFQVCLMLTLIGSLWMRYLLLPKFAGRIGKVKGVHRTGNQTIEKTSSKYLFRHRYRRISDKPNEGFFKSKRNKLAIPTIAVQRCTEKKINISFLNVNNAGSTKIEYMLQRFARKNDLNIVLPINSSGNYFNYLAHGEVLSKSSVVPLPENETYNILCNRIVYNKATFRSIMPNNTVYITMLQEPVSHFVSAATSFHFIGRLRASTKSMSNGSKLLSSFLKNPSNYTVSTGRVHNMMSSDLGIPPKRFKDSKFIDKYIEELGRDFILVAILERFLESLVLMKRTLCLETSDILFVSLNALKHKPQFKLSDNDIKNLRKWNSVDFKLYDYFYKVFAAKVKALGKDFQNEVESFKTIQERVEDYCKQVKQKKEAFHSLSVEHTRWGEGFTVTVNDCKTMMENEAAMVGRLVKQAWARYYRYKDSKNRKHRKIKP